MPIQSMYTTSTLPPWFAAQQQRLGEKAEATSAAGYMPYEKNRLAPFMNPDVEEAYRLARQTGIDLPIIQEAMGLSRAGGNAEFDMAEAAKYMNPYQKQVIENLVEQSNKGFNEQLLPRLQREFISTGNFGSTGHKAETDRLLAEHEKNLNRSVQEALMGGYSHAGKMFESAQARKLEAAPHMLEAAPLTRASQLADITKRSAIGEEQRARGQQEADIGYQDFQRQSNFPYEQQKHHAGILTGMTTPQDVYRAEQTPGAPQLNKLGELGGLAASIYGSRMAGGYGRKKGGAVRGLSRLPLMESTIARKPKVGGSLGVKHLKNKDKMLYGKSSRGRSIA